MAVVTTLRKCAHPRCTCLTDAKARYCSPQCEALARTPDFDCKCGHSDCQGRAKLNPVAGREA
jgi:hypothetical protein